MRKRKLQIFLSSTYEDLIDHRLAAMETILAAGHIPAAMEQFSAGDETAWDKIKAWIDESDAFILILGGRYGSIEPKSGKSYVQMEYEYAVEKKKPLFAVVVSDKHHEERMKQFGSSVDERQNQEKYKAFKAIVTQRLCKFWDDQKDIQSAIFQKLPEWAQRPDLTGWVRGDEAANPETANELARLSSENRELRTLVSDSSETVAGISLDEIVRLLSEHEVSAQQMMYAKQSDVRLLPLKLSGNLFDMFVTVFDTLNAGAVVTPNGSIFDELVAFGLLERRANTVLLTEEGRRFRNRLLAQGKFRVGS